MWGRKQSKYKKLRRGAENRKETYTISCVYTMSIQRKWRYGVYHTLGRPLEIVIYVISREPLWLVESQICLQLILCDLYRANHVLALHRFCQIFQLILRDLYRAKYAGSCPRIAQIFPNFPKWNIFLNQKVVIPERFGRVHTTLQSTYY